MNLKCKIVQKTSNKTGKTYEMLSIEVNPNYSIEVFLNKGDLELLKLYNQKA